MTYSCKRRKLTWTRLTQKEVKCGHQSSSNNETRWLEVMQQMASLHSSNMLLILMISMIWRRLLCPIKAPCRLVHKPISRKVAISRDEHKQMDTLSKLGVKQTRTTVMNSVRITVLGLEI